MADQITNYQCPSCNGPLHFAAGEDHLECEYCGSTFTLQEVTDFYKEKDQQAIAAKQEAEAAIEKEDRWDDENYIEGWGADAEKMRAYNCPSCGAQLIMDETTAASSCPYCGNPTIVPGKFTGMMKPDYVIPFKYDKKQAIAALKNYYKGKFFLPSLFHNENHIEEIQGVYVPFWLYEGSVDCDASFLATRSHVSRMGDTEIITTDHFNLHRNGNLPFRLIPADASTKMPDPHMDSIEPYDYSELTAFSTGYLPGYVAYKYDVSAKENAQRIANRAVSTAKSEIRGTVMGYDSVAVQNESYRVNADRVTYALMPIWMLITKWRGENYIFAMNGQTGKLVGDLPVDKRKFWLTAFLGANLFAIIAFLISFLF